MSNVRKIIFLIGLLVLFPSISLAASPKLFVAGWLPYWKKASSTADVIAHISVFSEVSPFSYTVKSDGTLIDTAKMTTEPWLSLRTTAKKQNVKIVPTVAWTDANAIHKVLSNYKLRFAHEKAITDMVAKNNFDGVDIDYEGKLADTYNYFSYFLGELSSTLHQQKKILICTVEARTPLDSRFSVAPKDIAYANDYAAFNKYCDSVRIMAYDQQFIDLKLNSAQKAGIPYAPVSDPLWVEKVVKLAAKQISLKKIVIGIPTYGYVYKITVSGTKFKYTELSAINPSEALALAAKNNVTTTRNSAGEISFMYHDAADNATTTRLVWWSDASAAGDKVALAKKLGVKGISIFKIDGGEDQGIWAKLK